MLDKWVNKDSVPQGGASLHKTLLSSYYPLPTPPQGFFPYIEV